MKASDFFVGGGYFGAGETQFPSESRYFDQRPIDNSINNNNNQFTVDDLLDFSKEDEVMTDAFFDSITADSSSFTNSSISGNEQPQLSGNISSRSFTESQFSGNELCVPYDDLAELEWLSNFVEESFSSDEMQNLQLISAAKAPTAAETRNYSSIFQNENVSVPGKARSKRSRAAPCDWSSRLQLLSSTTATKAVTVTTTPSKKRDAAETQTRKCLHCGSDKTPQWRTGPLGPKTLCNACGVRYKSGRLVPEYRPASSPSFVSAKHSNSHRKVLELRRQKELQCAQHQHLLAQSAIFGVSNGEDYLISGPNFRNF